MVLSPFMNAMTLRKTYNQTYELLSQRNKLLKAMVVSVTTML